MHTTLVRVTSGLSLSLALAACGDGGPAGPGTGTVEVTAATTGDIQVRLTAIRGNCRVQGDALRTIRLVAGETFPVRFDVLCVRAPLLGRIVFVGSRGGNFEVYSTSPEALARDAGGNIIHNRRFYWTSSNPGVATVSPYGETAVIRGVAPGTVTITARSTTLSASVAVEVEP